MCFSNAGAVMKGKRMDDGSDRKKKKSKRETRGINSFLRKGVGIGALDERVARN